MIELMTKNMSHIVQGDSLLDGWSITLRHPAEPNDWNRDTGTLFLQYFKSHI